MEPILTAEDIIKTYRDHTALDGVSVNIHPGRIFGLLGPNGAGKTTLIRIMTRILAPDSGKLSFNGEKLASRHIQRIGYLPEERGLYKKMKVGEQCLYLARLKGLSKKEAHEKLGKWFEKFEISGWWNKKIEELSKGMAQKLQFITTVIHDPEVLILDEPFSGFDPINAELIKQEILEQREKGTAIILSTHNMSSVEEICEEIALVNDGRIVLNGNISRIKQEYSQSIYDITFSGNLIGFTNALWTNFKLLHKEPEGEHYNARVQLLENTTLNDLLKVILPEVQVREVREIIPSMHDIFIRSVKGEPEEEDQTAGTGPPDENRENQNPQGS